MKKEMRHCQECLPGVWLLQGIFLCSLMTGKSQEREEVHLKISSSILYVEFSLTG